MEAWVWVVIALVLVVVTAVAWVVTRERQRVRVREQFGPEYDRAVAQHGDRRAAEKDLVERTRRRDELDIKPLTDGARARYSDEWQAIQGRFVDEPETAITEADSLLDRVMRDRGYPVDDFEDFETKAQLLSVDHPTVLGNYRAARAVQQRNATRLAGTEELREALLRYRSLFDELLQPDALTTTDTPETRG